MKIGFLGPRGTFSFEACKLYDNNSEYIEYKTISETIVALNNNEIDVAIVPIENSIQGGVTETIDTLVLFENIFVKDEIILEISQNLMANKNYNYNEIKAVYSHPQALAQSRNFMESNLKNAEIIPVSSTAIAAKEIKNKDYCACIANMSCVEEYGLTLIKDNIQDNDLNKTKFWVLSKENNKGGHKMSLVFSTKDKPGELYKILGLFDFSDINLTKIESRPAKKEFGDYIFLVDIEMNENVEPVLGLIKNHCSYFRILGKYETMRQ